MSAEGINLDNQRSMRAIALKAAVASMEPSRGDGLSLDDSRLRVIQQRALSFEEYLRSGDF